MYELMLDSSNVINHPYGFMDYTDYTPHIDMIKKMGWWIL